MLNDSEANRKRRIMRILECSLHLLTLQQIMAQANSELAGRASAFAGDEISRLLARMPGVCKKGNLYGLKRKEDVGQAGLSIFRRNS